MKTIRLLILVNILLGLTMTAVAASDILTIPVGHSKLLQVNGVDRLAVGNPEVIQAKVISPSRILINAKGEGRTNLLLWNGDLQEELAIEVRAWDLLQVKDYCRQLYGNKFKITEVNGKVYVTGVTDHKSEIKKGLETEFPGIIVGLRDAEKELPIADWEQQIRSATGSPNIKIRPLTDQSCLITGRVSRSEQLDAVQSIIKALPISVTNLVQVTNQKQEKKENDPQSGFEAVAKWLWPGKLTFHKTGGKLIVRGILSKSSFSKFNELLNETADSSIISLVQEEKSSPAAKQQIKVHLHLLEMNLQDLEELGFDWSDSVLWKSEGKNEGLLQIGSWIRETDLTTRLQVLATHGKVKILAEPELITVAGEEANIHVGGEIPVGGGESGIDWKEYGIQLRIVPTVQLDEQINLNIQATVSSLDWTNSIEFNNTVLPGISSSSFSTVLCQPSGSSSALGGLLERRTGVVTTGVPGLSALPLVGNLFAWNRNETVERELVAIVTPTLIKQGEDENLGKESTNKDVSEPSTEEISLQ